MDKDARLANLLRLYRNRQCVLFVGAGFSSGATRRDKDGLVESLPASQELASLMKGALSEDESDLGSLSDLYIDQFGEHGLFSLLNSLFTVAETTSTQRSIVNYRWKEIYTTNYDNVLELSCAATGVHFSTYTTTMRPGDIDYRNLPIIHINGFVPGATFHNFRKEIKLTNTQYYSDDFSRSAWGERFRNDIITSPCIVFAGYSLYDLDVARVLNTFEGMQDRIFFVLHERPSRASEKKLLGYGAIVTIGVDGLAGLLAEAKSEDISPSLPYFSAWERVELPQSANALRDIDVINFLMAGSVDEALFATDILENRYKLAINRTISDQISGLIHHRRLKNVIISANAGNGKSTTLDAIAYKLAARGNTVFRAGVHSSLLLKEVPLMRECDGPIVVVVDDALTNLDVLVALLALGRDDLFIVTSARTAEFDLRGGEIRKIFNNTIEHFSADELDDAEINQLIEFLDSYALWGARQTLPTERKKQFIRTNCSRELRSVILETLDSPNISNRIRLILDFDDDSQDRVRSVLLCSLLLSLAQIRPDLNLLSEMLGYDARKALVEREFELRDFSLIQNGRITIRSSIFAEFLLKKLIDTAFVIDAMSRAMINLDSIHDSDEIYRDIYKNFSRFRFVEFAIAIEKRRVHMIGYFENLKELSHCRENSLFWLQYAMCRLSLQQYPEAARLFEVAFAFSRKHGYRENRHLNNQFARFLLESRTNSNEYDDFMVAFNKAHAICIKQMHDEPQAQNPYRQAALYANFVERRISQLTAGDLLSVFRSCGEVNRFVARRKADKSISPSTIVDLCAEAMQRTVSRIRARLLEGGTKV